MQMDEFLEKRIKFKEELLRQYIELLKTKEGSDYNNPTIDVMLEELSKLYKQRKK